MIRSFGIFSLIALFALVGPSALADEKLIIQELRELRAIVEHQAKQIDVLTGEMTRLNQVLGARHGAAPIAEAPIEAPRAEPVEKAAPAEEGQRHIIVKGDNLTSIAKQYNVTLSELQKANKNVNPAKLQIGQSITIPTVKPAEHSAEKKETP